MFLIFSLHLFLQRFVQANVVVFANTLQTKLSRVLPITLQSLNSSKKLYKRSLISEEKLLPFKFKRGVQVNVGVKPETRRIIEYLLTLLLRYQNESIRER